MIRVHCAGCGVQLLAEHHTGPPTGDFITQRSADVAAFRARWVDGLCPDCQQDQA